ncbi:uncharacterized protein LOC132195344 isoform X2 [Neocloeon triangulifer]|uniref:uncharacterized protein LOC132195344 isoform X2 n=1 Tax=Neocloeon triangulifer TaxID=2078957 RepID=UPI00286ED9AB|nr:uncharacterized protein LOC132195344 isoform X2 [Neocloeon triangulifer]
MLKWSSVLLFLCITNNVLSNGANKREALLALIRKLQSIAENLEFPDSQTISSADLSNSTTTSAATTMTTTNNQKTTDPDSGKTYCNKAVCPQPKCTDVDKANLAKTRAVLAIPKIYAASETCDQRMVISFYKKLVKEAKDSCCVFNMTLVSPNSAAIMTCIKEVHAAERKSKATSAFVFWTSGIYSQECKAFVWCPEKEVIGTGVKWKVGFPKNDSGDCVAIQNGMTDEKENGLFNLKCNNNNINFICNAQDS